MQILKRLTAVHSLLLALGVLLTLCAWSAGGPTEILGTLPAILIAVSLAFNRYPGEELIARLAQRLQRPRRRPVSVSVPHRSLGFVGPRLLVLAGVRQLRGPPLSLTHSI